MARELITSWDDYQAAIDHLLVMAVHQISILDADLGHLHLDGSDRLKQLKRLVHSSRPDSLRIALTSADLLRRQQMPLMNLLASHSHSFSVQEIGPQLSHLRDCMILVDGRHGLIRFDRDQVRSKLLIDEGDELRPYQQRFEEIWREPGEIVSATTLGL